MTSGDTDLMSDLMAHGITIDMLHPLRHTTALMEATRQGRTEMVQWLLNHGAAPAFLSGLPAATALHCAIRAQRWAIAHMLIEAMENCAITDGNGGTPLHTLCALVTTTDDPLELLGLARALISANCPLSTLDNEGTTALHHCIVNDQRELAALLLVMGANPNASIPDSQVTPLTIAALEQNMEMAQLLLRYGATPHLATRDGATPLTIHPPLAELVHEGKSNKRVMVGAD